ncbi:MAG: cobalamin biosynthesis protein [Shimia sp.]|uniref:cobalamin biosynthesis protein n=1 Tax=Shimia sp. TaxID=1954381 RepID=UPI001B0A9EF0|nr:cobalamin biosynthesis protein [Shimia sp.]MBO6897023.1 cobalamin biosynthesis protein [Shimia sp.]
MIVAGFGFRASATEDSLRGALEMTAVAHVDAIATPTDKAHSNALQAFAKAHNLPVLEIDASAMQAVETQTQSAKVREKRGTGSVAEACALAVLKNATLTISRVVSADRLATCAIAQGEPL